MKFLLPLGPRFTLMLGVILFAARSDSWAAQKDYLVYFGTYTGAKSKGIYVARLDSATGKLGSPELAAEIASPSFLALHPKKDFLYAVNETGNFQGKKSGGVSAFKIDRETGKLSLLNQQPSVGDGPCHLVVDKRGRHVIAANYGSGSTIALAIDREGGLGESTAFIQHSGSSVNQERQQGPHAHCVTLDKANRFALVSDLGLDKVLVFKYDSARGTLAYNDPAAASVKPGAGPRHFAFEPRGRYGYVINEINCTVSAFSYNASRGELREIQSLSSLPAGETVQRGYSTAEITVHPSGRFVYGSNRGHDTIAVFAIDRKTGQLTLIQNQSTQGKTPRHFGIDPTGRWLLAENQDSDSVVVFGIDSQTGRLNPTGLTIGVGSPVCAVFLPVK